MSDSEKKTGKDVDYLHPDGQKKTPPHTQEEKENLDDAKDATKLAKELKVDKNK